jgi:hypothetical protein
MFPPLFSLFAHVQILWLRLGPGSKKAGRNVFGGTPNTAGVKSEQQRAGQMELQRAGPQRCGLHRCGLCAPPKKG